MLGNIEKSLIPIFVTILTLSSQAIPSLSIPTLYFCLYKEIKRSKMAIENYPTSVTQDKFPKSLLASMMSLLGWVPSSFLITLTLIWHHYPFKILIWTIVIFQPINMIINPIVFSILKLIHKFIKMQCRV